MHNLAKPIEIYFALIIPIKLIPQKIHFPLRHIFPFRPNNLLQILPGNIAFRLLVILLEDFLQLGSGFDLPWIRRDDSHEGVKVKAPDALLVVLGNDVIGGLFGCVEIVF
jgi:hypothetical protein